MARKIAMAEVNNVINRTKGAEMEQLVLILKLAATLKRPFDHDLLSELP